MGAEPKVYSLTVVTGTGERRGAANAAFALGGAAAFALLQALARRWRERRAAAAGALGGGGSAHASVGGAADGARAAAAAAAAAERRTVDRLLQQLAPPEEVLCRRPDALSLGDALRLPRRLAALAARHCAALRDASGDAEPPAALDLGCGVGAVAFELSAAGFASVVGLDADRHVVNAARALGERGWARLVLAAEGGLGAEATAALPAGARPAAVAFEAGDPGAPPEALGTFDCVVAARLLSRLPDPARLLAAAPALLRRRGVLLVADAWEWREDVTPVAGWLGGYTRPDGAEARSLDGLRAALGGAMELVEQAELPFLERRDARNYALGWAQVSVWRRRD